MMSRVAAAAKCTVDKKIKRWLLRVRLDRFDRILGWEMKARGLRRGAIVMR